ncbi:MAG TPA: hypothetical protein VIK80_08120 [Flavihumibacter sp.]|jgi:hypothetical protein
MNRIICQFLTVASILIVNTAGAFPFTHFSGLFGDLTAEEQVAENDEENKVIERVTVPAIGAYEDNDTVPGSLEAHIRSIDEAVQKLGRQIAEKDWIRVQQAMETSLERFNPAEFQEQINKARQHLIESKEQLNSHLQNVLSSDALAEQLKSVEKAMEKLEIEQGLMKETVLKQREKIKSEMQRTLPKVEEELKKAKIQLEKAGTELRGYMKMISEMHTEGLIKDRNNYRIAFHEGELLINGVKQSEAVYNKYKSYFSEPGTVIENKNNIIQIHSETEL